MIHYFCGEEVGSTLADALDGLDFWLHIVDHTHRFDLDLGASYNISKVRGRSLTARDPTDVTIWVSDDPNDWGAAVKAGIATWKDTLDWVEIDTTPKIGRYMSIRIYQTENVDDHIQWGKVLGAKMTIFDAYGALIEASRTGSISLDTHQGYDNIQYIDTTFYNTEARMLTMDQG